MKILIIEDDQQCQESLAFAFSVYWTEAEILPAYCGSEGMKLARERQPDIILLDLGLPDVNGFTMLSELRSVSEAPIAILSARDEENTVKTVHEMGAAEYIIKPFSPRRLVERLKQIVSH